MDFFASGLIWQPYIPLQVSPLYQKPQSPLHNGKGGKTRLPRSYLNFGTPPSTLSPTSVATLIPGGRGGSRRTRTRTRSYRLLERPPEPPPGMLL